MDLVIKEVNKATMDEMVAAIDGLPVVVLERIEAAARAAIYERVLDDYAGQYQAAAVAQALAEAA